MDDDQCLGFVPVSCYPSARLTVRTRCGPPLSRKSQTCTKKHYPNGNVPAIADKNEKRVPGSRVLRSPPDAERSYIVE